MYGRGTNLFSTQILKQANLYRNKKLNLSNIVNNIQYNMVNDTMNSTVIFLQLINTHTIIMIKMTLRHLTKEKIIPLTKCKIVCKMLTYFIIVKVNTPK